MLSTIRLAKVTSVLFATAVVLAGMATPSRADNGTVSLSIFKAGFIVGAGGGKGTLNFKGKTYRLGVGGVGIGSIGIASVRLVGTATNMRVPSDIAGTYGAAGAGATFVGGAQVATLQNEKGVVLTVKGAQVGFQASLGVAGMTITMR